MNRVEFQCVVNDFLQHTETILKSAMIIQCFLLKKNILGVSRANSSFHSISVKLCHLNQDVITREKEMF